MGVYGGTPVAGYQSDLQRVNGTGLQMAGSFLANDLAQRTNAAMGAVQANPVAAQQIRGANINVNPFNRAMRAQDALAGQGGQALGMLQQAAQGAVPSAAELQGRQQLQQALANTQSMAASSRGGADARAAAQRQAMMTNAQISGQVINQAQAGRAAEMAAARGQLVAGVGQQQGLAQQQAGQFAQMAQASAGLRQQAALANQGASLQAAQAQQQGILAGQALDQQAITGAAGLYSNLNNQNLAQVGYNNQLSQLDFERQMALNSQRLQRYGIERNVAIGQYQADASLAAAREQAEAQMVGAGLNAGGQLISAGINAAFG